MKWLRISLFAQLILAAYFQAIQWLRLGSWNYQPGFTPLGLQAARHQLGIADVLLVGAFLLPPALFVFAYLYRLRWLLWVCTVGYSIWLLLQIKTWWVAYLFGASDSWVAVYRRVFSQSTQVLPTFGRHLPPDGMHLVLQLLLVGAVTFAFVGLLGPWPCVQRPNAAD